MLMMMNVLTKEMRRAEEAEMQKESTVTDGQTPLTYNTNIPWIFA